MKNIGAAFLRWLQTDHRLSLYHCSRMRGRVPTARSMGLSAQDRGSAVATLVGPVHRAPVVVIATGDHRFPKWARPASV